MSRQRHQSASFEFPRNELLPVVTIGIGTAENQCFVPVHQRQFAATNSNVATIRHVDGVLPENLTGLVIDCNGQASIQLLQPVFRELSGFARE